MDFKTYQQAAERTLNSDLSEKMAKSNIGLGIGGEAGEVQDIIKKNVCHGHPYYAAREALIEEIGDLLWYVSGVASLYHIDLDTIATHNIEKLTTRYPSGFNTADSIARVDHATS